MKLQHFLLFAAMTGVAAAAPDQPGFTTPPDWIDLNNNGEIDEAERDAFIQARKDAAGSLADQADSNGDGHVDDEERQAMIDELRAKAEERLCELFEAVAGDDGVLTLTEFSELKPVSNIPGPVASALFALLDGDGDGEVTKEEFIAAISGDVNVPDDPESPSAPLP